jgi:hypothetical protein
MKLSECICRKCGNGVDAACDLGNYLNRVNKGELPSLWECAPSCGNNVNDVQPVIKAIKESK